MEFLVGTAGGWVTGLPVNAGELEAEGRMLFAFVLGVNEPAGFLLVGGGEGFLFARLSVLAVLDAPAPAERARHQRSKTFRRHLH